MTNHLHQHRMQGAAEHKNGDSWSKQPRALEDGNWVCEDSQCNNVNYPRRTQCHKCKKKRGPAGDAIVRAYLESLNTKRGDFLKPVAMCYPMVTNEEHMAMTRGMFPPGGFNIPHQKLAPIGSNFCRDLNPGMGTGFEKLPPFGPQYIGGNRGYPGCISMPRVVTEGKQLAEHLVASFAASADPLGDAGKCLASAAMWLQNMKSRWKKEDCQIPTSFVPTESAHVGGIPAFSMASLTGSINMQSQAATNMHQMDNLMTLSSSILGNSPAPRAVQQTNQDCQDFTDDNSNDFLKGNPWSLPEVL